MEVIRKKIRVDATRRVTLELPEHIQPGDHDVLVVVGPSALREKALGDGAGPDEEREPLGAWLRRTAHDTGPLEETTYRREDLYGDFGR